MVIDLTKKTDKEIIDLLKTTYKDKDIVIHYICRECDDEQVTYEERIDDDFFRRFDNDSIFVTLECTNCDYEEKFLPIGNIIAFEIV